MDIVHIGVLLFNTNDHREYMELREALKKAQADTRISRPDMLLINQLQRAENISSTQYEFAVRALKKYGIEVEKKIQARRAVLRENRICHHGELREEDQKKIDNIPGMILYRGEIHFPCNHYTIKILKEMKYELSQNILEWEENNKPVKPPLGEFDPRLYPYQREDVLRVEELKGRCLIGSDMGVGKTCIACTYIARHPELNLILIVVPASLKLNWEQELRQWNCDKKITIINGTKSRLPESGIVIISYNVVYSYFCDIDDLDVDLLILDESHFIKRAESQRSKAIKYLGAGIEKIICISGTPITSRPKEFFTTLNLLNREMFNSREKFLRRYCNSDRDPTGNGCSNSQELHEILKQSLLIRRLKKDVLTQLPPKVYSVIPIEMDQENRNNYEFARKEIIGYLRENYSKDVANRAKLAETIVRMAHLRQLAVAGKIDESIEFVRNMVDSDEKLVLFAIHKVVINRLMEEFGDIAVKIDGSVNQKQRQENVDRFQNDDRIRIFVGQIDSAGVGITLTASSNVVFFEYPFNPGQVSQAIDRTHRIGQEAESINVWYLVAENTIDADIAKLLDRKAKVLADVLDGGDLDENILINELIEKLLI